MDSQTIYRSDLPSLGEIITDETTLQAQPWEVRDLAGATWAAEKALHATAEIAKIEAHKRELLNRVEAWAAGEKERHERTIDTMKYHLHAWFQGQDTGKKKSLDLPNGARIGVRSNPGSVICDDEAVEELTEKGYGASVKYEPKIDKKMVRRLIEGGTTFEHVSLSDSTETFYLKEPSEY